MLHSPSQIDTHEIHKALDDLLHTFLVISPRNADLPAVKRARDLVSRYPRSLQCIAQNEGCMHEDPRADRDIPDSFIIGSE